MSQYGYAENREAILKRLKRAEGQIRGIAGMVEADKYCIEILTQISAAQAALDKVTIELLRDHAQHCMTSARTTTEKQQKADELVQAIARMRS